MVGQAFLCHEHERKQSTGSANVTRKLHLLILQQAMYAVCTLPNLQKKRTVLMLYMFSVP